MVSEFHRIIGAERGRIDSDMVDNAIEMGLEESRGLDYKVKPVAAKGLKHSDVPKDVAAMGNSGGGVIIYGVEEDGEGKPKTRKSVSEIVENEDIYSRTYLQVLANRISPAILGVEVYFVGDIANRVMVVEVPASRFIPHMVNSPKNSEFSCFSVPYRNGASTLFLSEREISRLYSDRFFSKEAARKRLSELFSDTVELGDELSVWIVGVSIPSQDALQVELSKKDAVLMAEKASEGRQKYGYYGNPSPLSAVYLDAKRGLRKWRFHKRGKEGTGSFFVELGDGGDVQTLSLGNSDIFSRDEVLGEWAEWTIIDTFLAARQQAMRTGVGEFDFMFGLVWFDDREKCFVYADESSDVYFYERERFKKFKPITASFDLLSSTKLVDAFLYNVVTDFVNQAGHLSPRTLQERY